MTIVITMAGMGSRFRKAGYNVPKYRIEVFGKTLFEWSMESLEGFELQDSHCIFIVRRADESADFITSTCAKLGISKVDVIEIDEMTDGQATTAMLANKAWDADDSLLIYNIDTYVEANQMKMSQMRGDGFIPCFVAEGDHWSFAKLDDNGKVVEVREKQRISDYCTLGAYYFKTCGLYETLYKEYYSKDDKLEKGEKYVAPLYNYMIEKGNEVYISVVDNSAVHVLGTPEELDYFKETYTP